LRGLFNAGLPYIYQKIKMTAKNHLHSAIFLTVFLFCAVAAGKAQVTKDSLLKAMSKEVCEDVMKKDFTGKNADEIQMEIGMSFIPVMGKYEKELKAVYGDVVAGTDGIEKVGEDLGMRLVLECPAFLKLMASNPGMVNKTEPVVINTINGTLVKVVPGEFTHLLIKDNKGKMMKIWWMESFDGSGELTRNPQSWINKKVTVSYTEKELYSAGTKKYNTVKIAAGIEKQ
jgi:hypothetical protein